MERTIAMKTIDSKLRDRDASFSSYLIPEKLNHHHNHQTLDESASELNVFDAHKYFNEVTNNENNNIQKVTISSSNNSRVSPVVVNVNTDTTRYSSASSSSIDGCYSSIRNYRTRSFHSAATPTASSEASWNSKQGLLSHPPGAISVSMKNPSNPNPNSSSSNLNNKLKKSLSKPIWLLRRKCPCTGKKSVQVKEQKSTQQTQPKTMNTELEETVSPIKWVNVDQTESHLAVKSQRFTSHPLVSTVRAPLGEGFTFPVLNQHHATSAAAKLSKLLVVNGVVLDDARRDSLEVFQPPDEVTVEPKQLNFPFPPGVSRVVADDGDAASDVSSDLFEIESFSAATQSTCPTACRRSSRDLFDDGMTMTECYEPSEASIEWSVTTADGNDEIGGGNVAAEQWRRKGGNGLLVSCRCEKAVSVGPHPQPVKCGGEATSEWRHVIGGNVIGGNSSNNRVVIGSVNKPPLARSHRNTPRVTSIAFAT